MIGCVEKSTHPFFANCRSLCINAVNPLETQYRKKQYLIVKVLARTLRI